jgi:FkbM family methyltransferase
MIDLEAEQIVNHDYKYTIVQKLRNLAILRTLLDDLPTKCVFSNQIAYKVPRSVLRQWTLWRQYGASEIDNVYKEYNGGDFIDIGAFHGFYSLLLGPKAVPGSTFVSLEPNRKALPRLLRSITTAAELFPHVRFIVLPIAAGDGGSVAVSYPDGADGHPAYNSNETDESEREGTTDATTMIDSLVSVLRLKPSFVKIDVEGAEYAVLRGMGSSIKTYRPSMMLEVHPDWQPAGVSLAMVENLLKESSYRHRIITHDVMSDRLLVSPE